MIRESTRGAFSGHLHAFHLCQVSGRPRTELGPAAAARGLHLSVATPNQHVDGSKRGLQDACQIPESSDGCRLSPRQSNLSRNREPQATIKQKATGPRQEITRWYTRLWAISSLSSRREGPQERGFKCEKRRDQKAS